MRRGELRIGRPGLMQKSVPVLAHQRMNHRFQPREAAWILSQAGRQNSSVDPAPPGSGREKHGQAPK